MSKGKGYLLPAGDAFTDQMTCVRVYVPNRVEYLRALVGSLDYLAGWNAWERDELHRGIQAAASWRIANELTNDTIDAGCPPELPPPIIIDDDGNIHLHLECDEMCTINIYCNDADINPPPTNGGDDDAPPFIPPGAILPDGYKWVSPVAEDFIVYHGYLAQQEWPNLIYDLQTPGLWWWYGDNPYGASNEWMAVWPRPTVLGNLAGVVFKWISYAGLQGTQVTFDTIVTNVAHTMASVPVAAGYYDTNDSTIGDWMQNLVLEGSLDEAANVLVPGGVSLRMKGLVSSAATWSVAMTGVYFIFTDPLA